MKASDKLIKAVEKFNEDLKAFANECGEEVITLYEDAFATREVKANFHLCKNGVLTWSEKSEGVMRSERYDHWDEDDVRDTLKFWRANLRRAKKYWAMDSEILDKIQDGEIEDINEE